jgi:hypothetical protein
MNSKTYWRETQAQNPAFADESKTVKISVTKIKALMDAAHAEGCREAADLQRMCSDYRRGTAWEALGAILKIKPE